MERKQKEVIKIKHIIIILTIIGLGLFILSQALSLAYKNILLTDPCRLCKQYNEVKYSWDNLNLSELLNQSSNSHYNYSSS